MLEIVVNEYEKDTVGQAENRRPKRLENIMKKSRSMKIKSIRETI